jgi:hypothetical protein
VALPNYTFTAADAGQHTFSFTPKTSGTQWFGVQDTAVQRLQAWPTFQVSAAAAAAARLSISGAPPSMAAGAVGQLLLTAYDAYGNVATNYRGRVHFSTTDTNGYVGPDHTFTAADAGQYWFTIQLITAGARSVTAQDTATSTLQATQTGIAVTPGAAVYLVISGLPSSLRAGQAGTFTVTAYDVYGNVATGYRGTVYFASGDARAALPANYTFTAADAGRHTFSFTLRTIGLVWFGVCDRANSNLGDWSWVVPVVA